MVTTLAEDYRNPMEAVMKLSSLIEDLREHKEAMERRDSGEIRALRVALEDQGSELRDQGRALRDHIIEEKVLPGRMDAVDRKVDALDGKVEAQGGKIDQMHEWLAPKIELEQAQEIVEADVKRKITRWRDRLNAAKPVVWLFVVLGFAVAAGLFYIKTGVNIWPAVMR